MFSENIWLLWSFSRLVMSCHEPAPSNNGDSGEQQTAALGLNSSNQKWCHGCLTIEMIGIWNDSLRFNKEVLGSTNWRNNKSTANQSSEVSDIFQGFAHTGSTDWASTQIVKDMEASWNIMDSKCKLMDWSITNFCPSCFQGQIAIAFRDPIQYIQCNWVLQLQRFIPLPWRNRTNLVPFPPGGAGDCGGDHGGGLGGGDGKRVADGGAGGLIHCFLARSSCLCCLFTFLFKMTHLSSIYLYSQTTSYFPLASCKDQTLLSQGRRDPKILSIKSAAYFAWFLLNIESLPCSHQPYIIRRHDRSICTCQNWTEVLTTSSLWWKPFLWVQQQDLG